MELTLWSVGRMFGKSVPPLGKRSWCLIRKHRRSAKSFTVFRARSGAVLYKCHSCDPPVDVGDAVGLYAALENVDRRSAWATLKDQGYEVPGLREQGAPFRRGRPAAPVRPPVVPTRGEEPSATIPLDPERWEEHVARRVGAVEKLAAERQLDPSVLRELDVVDIDASHVGFGYREPTGGVACRVKVRGLERKSFWIEPRGDSGKALAPLYLAHALSPSLRFVVVHEGEIDALTLAQARLPNSVSLPDGARSAATVDLRPLRNYPLWLLATDDDEAGQRGAAVLERRASQLGCQAVRVRWGAAGHVCKDASEAWVKGARRATMSACLSDACHAALGYRVEV